MARTKGAKADKNWTEALRLAVNREETDEGKKRRRLSLIADKLCKLAMDGDIAAIREIGDRLDGKPAQAIQGDPDAPLSMIHTIKRTIVDPGNSDS